MMELLEGPTVRHLLHHHNKLRLLFEARSHDHELWIFPARGISECILDARPPILLYDVAQIFWAGHL